MVWNLARVLDMLRDLLSLKYISTGVNDWGTFDLYLNKYLSPTIISELYSGNIWSGPVFRIKIRLKLKKKLLWTFFETYYNNYWRLVFNKICPPTRPLGILRIFMKEKINFVLATAMKKSWATKQQDQLYYI